MTTTKDLSVLQFFEVLQEEYIVCELRVKIYPIKKHKQYWKNLADEKAKKIIDIAERNNLPSIFSDRRTKRSLESRIYSDFGLPNFYYPNPEKKEQQHKWDIINYYWPNADVRIKTGTNIDLGKIVSFDSESKLVEVLVDGVLKAVSINRVSRVL